MSVDFTADFDLRGDFRGAEWLRDALAEEPAGIREVVARYRDRWQVKEWKLEESKLWGPGGFAMTVSPSGLEVYHLLPFFRCFAADEELRTELRRACRVIATLVGSPRAIYRHEALPVDGNLDEVEAKLRTLFGPPSATFADLAVSDAYSPGCWYIDDFTDLR